MAQTNQFKIPECAPTTKSFREANQFTSWKSKQSSGIGPSGYICAKRGCRDWNADGVFGAPAYARPVDPLI